MADELLPCPFHTQSAGRPENNFPYAAPKLVQGFRWQVRCGCCAEGPSMGSREAAIAAWNTRAQGPGPTSPCYECGTDNLIGPICGGCNPEIAAMVDGGPGPGEAVAWRVKDFADGWTLYANKDAADVASLASSGALVEALGVIAATPTREG
ncbi:hypothetical protein J2X45_003885 [Caulobacter sp. BE264]|nr:hypothetical protein [Caulobacter sp. BE264]